MDKILFTIVCIWLINYSQGQYRDEECLEKESGKKGLCLRINQCSEALDLLQKGKRPQHCGGFVELDPIVCCPKTKSQIKCLTYYKQADFGPAVFGGEQSLAKEFPHMAIVGFGDEGDKQWQCGGTLISEDFVLTAAHCSNSRDLGRAKWVRLGDLDIKDTKDDARPQDFSIVQIIVHPSYKSPSHYHDIALMRLNRRATFDDYVKPACLHTDFSAPPQLTVTGWGKVEFFGETSSHLLKATINLINHTSCKRSFANASKRRLANGIVDSQQVCAGDSSGKDTCPGDSGGPLQMLEFGRPSYFKVVGVTSFGKGCGVENSVGVYTRVANYVKWIEDIVWPDQ